MTKSQAATTAKQEQANEARRKAMQAKRDQSLKDAVKTATNQWGNPLVTFKTIADTVLKSVRSDNELTNLISSFIYEHNVTAEQSRLLVEAILFTVKSKTRDYADNEKTYRAKVGRVVEKCLAMSSPTERKAQSKAEQRKKFDALVKSGTQALESEAVAPSAIAELEKKRPESAQRAIERIASAVSPQIRAFAIINSVGSDWDAWEKIITRALAEYGQPLAHVLKTALDNFNASNEALQMAQAQAQAN